MSQQPTAGATSKVGNTTATATAAATTPRSRPSTPSGLSSPSSRRRDNSNSNSNKKQEEQQQLVLISQRLKILDLRDLLGCGFSSSPGQSPNKMLRKLVLCHNQITHLPKVSFPSKLLLSNHERARKVFFLS